MSASTERKNRAAARAAGTDKKTIAAREAEQKARKSKRKWIIGTVAVVLCIALVLLLSSPAMYRITTAETVCGKNYSPAEIKYVRANAKSSLMGYGYDNLVSYLGQESADQLLEEAVNGQLVRTAALLQVAREEGVSLTQKQLAHVDEIMDQQMDYLRQAAKDNGVSLSTYLSYVFGAGVNERVFRDSMRDEVLTNKVYFHQFCSLTFTPEELAAYYENEADGDVFTYLTFAVKPSETLPGDDLPFAAQALVDGFQDGYDGSVDPATAFADLIAEDFPDGSPSLRSKVTGANLEENLRDWLTDPARQTGDITAVPGSDGQSWTVVLFQERGDNSDTVVAVRHILVKAEANEDGVYTDEAKEAALAKAQEILAAFEAGEQTEEEFATLAYLYSQDSGSSSNGGLYSSVTPGQMVEEFDRFCFEEHQFGDTAIVYGESGSYAGYHVMFFVQALPARDAAARDALRGTAMNDWISSLTEGMEPELRWAYKLVD